MFVPQVSFLHLWAWTFIAVIIHVLVDIFNAYGTQAIRPFSSKWVAHGFINTFDPYIFFMHIIGIIAWLLGAEPGFTWLVIYTVLLLYYVKRYIDKREIVKELYNYFPNIEKITTSPTIKQNYWKITVTTSEHFYVGTVENGHIKIHDELDRKSTRLNSSHVAISYAVFCLKKKMNGGGRVDKEGVGEEAKA